MIRRRAKKAVLAVSLFPFLAVLICTMGILIVLLVIAVKAADADSKSEIEDRTKQHAMLEQLQFEADSQALTIDVVEKSRAGVAKRLDNQRLRRSHIQQAIRNVEKEQQQLLAEIEQFQAINESNVDLDQQAKEIENLTGSIASGKKKLRKKIAKRNSVPTSYAIVPGKTANGTNRRPIYLECTAEGVTLQPGGQLISIEELSPPVIPGNPLDAALLAVREYWIGNKVAGQDGEPYPLLVVRPDGSSSYALARRAMKSWDEQFGYELVDSTRKLAFGDADQLLDSIVNETIDKANRFRAQQIALLRREETIRAAQQGTMQRSNGYRVTKNGLQPIDGAGIPLAASVNSRDSNPYDFETSQEQQSGHSGQGEKSDSQFAGNRGESQFENHQDKAGQFAGSQSAQQHNGRLDTQSAMNNSSTMQDGNLQAGNQKAMNPYRPDASQPAPVNSLAARRGANWALPDMTPGATAYRRPIRINLGPDRMTVQSGASVDQRPDVIEFDGSTELALDMLVQSVWKMIDGWGIAGANGYWKPELKMSVERGAETRLSEIMALMRGSGLDIVGGEQ